MIRLFRSKSYNIDRTTEVNRSLSLPNMVYNHCLDQDEEAEDENRSDADYPTHTPISTPLIGPGSRYGEDKSQEEDDNTGSGHNPFPILDILAAALRKSLITCSVERDDVCSIDISWPTEVRHVSHVTFDRFNGFLGLPTELEPEISKTPPSASVRIFGVSAKSMQCSYDGKGNSVPTILLMMQDRLYAEGGLKAEGIFRINPENSQEEYVRDQLNKGVVPHGMDVHCLAGLIKAWFRELPTGVLDSLAPEQVMNCNTEDDCTQLLMILPATEAALLDWAINLMADVVQHEQFNKMNARNIAMVFAPNMTQMADPLTALIHAVQVMNFLKTLILKNIKERNEETVETRLFSSDIDSPTDDTISKPPPKAINLFGQTSNPCVPNISKLHTTNTTGHFEHEIAEKTYMNEIKSLENGERLSLRKGVRKLCQHPVFQLTKPLKKTRSLGFVNARGEGGGSEAWV